MASSPAFPPRTDVPPENASLHDNPIPSIAITIVLTALGAFWLAVGLGIGGGLIWLATHR